MKKKSVLLIGCLVFGMNAFSQKSHKYDHGYNRNHHILTAFADSLANLRASYYAYFRMWDDPEAPFPKKVRPNPDLYKLFVPPTYYEEPIRQISELKWSISDFEQNYWKHDSLFFEKKDSVKIFEVVDLEKSKNTDKWVNTILLNVYLTNPNIVKGNEMYLKDLKPLSDINVIKKPKKEHVISLLQPESIVENVVSDKDLLVVKPNFWTHKGNGYAQFTQLYISDNWYKGGESTNALLSGLILEANYNDRQKVQFENRMEIKLGFVTAPSDTVHKYKTNADLFRLTSKLGLQAHKNWYYTVGADLKTQFFANYKTNTNDMISNFLSPAQLDITLGMDFKQNKKKYSLSLLTSPLAYTFIYIKDNDRIINTTTFNVPEGQKTANLFGSKFTGTLQWKIIPSIVWDSKLEYFTTYEKVIASWENTFSFNLNRYLSTKLFVHARYDDGVKLSGDNKSYFQLQELLSFGLNYNW